MFIEKKVRDKYESGAIGHFCAGEIGEYDKIMDYRNKFENLNVKNYRFLPLAMESFGGINRNIRTIIDNVMNLKSKRLKRDINILKSNFYIKFSMFYKKLLIKSILNHYQLVDE